MKVKLNLSNFNDELQGEHKIGIKNANLVQNIPKAQDGTKVKKQQRLKFTPEQIASLERQATKVPGMNNSGMSTYRTQGEQAQQYQEQEEKRKEEEIKSRSERPHVIKQKASFSEKLRGGNDEYEQTSQVIGMSGADPIGEFVLAGVGLNGIGALAKTGLWNVAKYAPTTQLGNYGRQYFVGNTLKNSFNGVVPASQLASKNLVKTEPTNQKRVVSEGTYPLYRGRQHSVKEVVNSDGTVNPRQAMRIQHEISEQFPGSYKMEHRLENPESHKTDPTTFHHTKNVAQSAWRLDIPDGFTKHDQMIAALGHDFGKIVAGDGHAQIGADLAKQVFPDLTDAQYKAIAEHMGTPKTVLGKATKAADIDNGKTLPENVANITDAQWDDMYGSAIKAGNMAEAQRLRDLHFKVSAPNTQIKDIQYHGAKGNAKFNIFDPKLIGQTDQGWAGRGYYFTPSIDYAKMYGSEPRAFYINAQKVHDGTASAYFGREDSPAARAFKIIRKRHGDDGQQILNDLASSDAIRTSFSQTQPYNGIFEEVVTRNNNQMKLADAVTYDDTGNIIPLSQRDNFNINDIRYGLLPFIGGYSLYNMLNNQNNQKLEYRKQGGKMEINFLKNGNKIHIKKKNRGKFTDYCGGKVTDECIRKAKASGNPKLVKRATFAANARKWKHQEGGIL